MQDFPCVYTVYIGDWAKGYYTSLERAKYVAQYTRGDPSWVIHPNVGAHVCVTPVTDVGEERVIYTPTSYEQPFEGFFEFLRDSSGGRYLYKVYVEVGSDTKVHHRLSLLEAQRVACRIHAELLLTKPDKDWDVHIESNPINLPVSSFNASIEHNPMEDVEDCWNHNAYGLDPITRAFVG